MNMRPVLVITGPTAAGKTAAALEVDQKFGVRLVSADAMQVYRGLDIGTAKESADVLTRHPHAGIDIREPNESFDAQAFVEMADAIVGEGQRVLIVGGSTFYVHAFLYGLVDTPDVDAELRQRLEAMEDPHAELVRVDPVLAERLHPNDRVRVVRGLEVFLLTGQRLSDLHAAHGDTPRHNARVLWLDREDLRERIDARVDAMMDAGYLGEVERLLQAGVSRQAKPMQSLGYRHLADHLEGLIGLDEAIWRTKRDTWRFARKQRTASNRFPTLERIHADAVGEVLAIAEEMWA